MNAFLQNPIFMILLCILVGQFWGKIGPRHFKLGSSATFFVSILLGYLLGHS